MPYLITTSVYPAEIRTEVATRYLEAMEKFPPDESLTVPLVPAAVKATLDGIKVIGISEVKEGKLGEALDRTAKMMVMFQTLPGYRYTVEVFYKVEEALALIGMDPPA